MSKTIAIITARGGSKRIPRKNIKDFLGKPIIAYSIEVAIQTNMFDEIMVSTDDEEIAQIAIKYGAKVPFLRSAKNSDDYTGTVDVLLEVLEDYQKLGKTYEYGCCIYPTAPFITSGKLFHSYEQLINNAFDSVFPVTRFGYPIQRALKIDSSQRAKMFSPEHLTSRSQDLEPAFHDVGQFYWFCTNSLSKSKSLWTDNTGVIVLSEMEAHDIDTLEDWETAEFKYKLLHR